MHFRVLYVVMDCSGTSVLSARRRRGAKPLLLRQQQAAGQCRRRRCGVPAAVCCGSGNLETDPFAHSRVHRDGYTFARPCKQAQPQALTTRSLSNLRVSERPVQALTPGPFRFLGFLREPCVRCCGFTRHSCCGNSDAACCGSGGGFKKHRIPRKSHRSSTLTRIFGGQRSRSSKPMEVPKFQHHV